MRIGFCTVVLATSLGVMFLATDSPLLCGTAANQVQDFEPLWFVGSIKISALSELAYTIRTYPVILYVEQCFINKALGINRCRLFSGWLWYQEADVVKTVEGEITPVELIDVPGKIFCGGFFFEDTVLAAYEDSDEEKLPRGLRPFLDTVNSDSKGVLS